MAWALETGGCTGQHYDPVMSEVFFTHFLGTGSVTRAVQTCRVMTALQPLAVELTPIRWSWSAT